MACEIEIEIINEEEEKIVLHYTNGTYILSHNKLSAIK